MIGSPFFTSFLRLSNFFTLIGIIALIGIFIVLKILKQKRVSFSTRMIVALVLGLALGAALDVIGTSASMGGLYKEYASKELTDWFRLVGYGFLRFVQLLAVPVVFLSIIKVVTEIDGKNIKALTWKSFAMLLGTTAIAAIVGIGVVYLFGLDGASLASDLKESQSETIAKIASQSFPEFFLQLVPSNIFAAFSSNNSIVSVVIISALFASAIRFLKVKKPEQVAPFVTLLDSLRVTVTSVLTNVIKFMPYGVVALVANTIVSNGIGAILNMISFIAALYLGVLIMLLVYVVILVFTGVNPIQFYKKSFSTMLFAFSSRSSVGTLPYTLKTLETLGVSGETANFVGTLGTTIGMNGCAGVFPAMLAIIVGAASGVPINLAYIVLVILVVTIGSIGIAGVPGTATVAATVTLNGVGLGSAISKIGAVFAIDPIIDMGRTLLNVTGAMVSAIVVDKANGHFQQDIFNQKTATDE